MTCPLVQPLAYPARDPSAATYLATVPPASRRAAQSRLDLLVRTMLARPTPPRPPIGARRLRIDPAVIPWRTLDAATCTALRDRLLATYAPRSVGAVLGILRGVLRVALAGDHGRLFDCLAALRVADQRPVGRSIRELVREWAADESQAVIERGWSARPVAPVDPRRGPDGRWRRAAEHQPDQRLA